MSLTPHGPGFAFLDAFEATVPGQIGRGLKRLDPSLPFFTDHFPGDPLMPGVLLIECGAQAAGALWASRGEARPHFILAQVMQFRILQPVLPGDTVATAVTFEQALGSLAQFGVVLTVGEREVARGRLVLSR